MSDSLFHRAELLLGSETMSRLSQLNVIIFGVGGVGSWCAEALARNGVGRMTIVDGDRVCESNINRQLMATTSTIGLPKVEALRERLLDINPSIKVTALQMVFTQETADSFHLDDYDYVIDAIDSLSDKALLIRLATQSRATLFSSMGAALKLDPAKIKVTEFWRVEGDPLARTLRKRFKSEGLFPAKKFMCVYSDEQRDTSKGANTNKDAGSQHRKVNGSLVHITAIFGLTLASLVVRDQLSKS